MPYLLVDCRQTLCKQSPRLIVFTSGTVCWMLRKEFALYDGEPFGLATRVADIRPDNTTGRLKIIQV